MNTTVPIGDTMSGVQISSFVVQTVQQTLALSALIFIVWL